MRVISAIFWKEFKGYFLSPVAYVVLTGFTAISGWLFYQLLNYFIRITNMMSGYMVKGQIIREWTIVDDIMGPLYKNLSLFLIILVPGITMRLFSEEKKLKTEELLLTCPIRMGQVVIGKYLASLALLILMLIPVGVYLAIILKYGTEPDIGALVAGYLGLFLVAFALTAVGIFASSLTENQIISFFVCAVIGLFFFSIGLAARSVETITVFSRRMDLSEFFRQLSLFEHYSNMVAGRIQITDLVYFLLMIVFFLFSAWVNVGSARWA
jgi:ABC-2 type transport system permease protein